MMQNLSLRNRSSKKIKAHNFAISVILLFFFVSCVSIPKQAPELSEELGKKIGSLNKSHLNLTHLYFDQKRSLVDDFIDKTWLPEFASNFFQNPQVQQAWDEIVKSPNSKDRLDFLVQVGPELLKLVNAKREELMKPLNELEAVLISSIQNEYNLAMSASNTLTSFLTSAAQVKENQQRYLNMIGVTEEKISSVISQTDSAIDNLVKGGEKASSAVDKLQQESEEYKQKLSDLIKRFK